MKANKNETTIPFGNITWNTKSVPASAIVKYNESALCAHLIGAVTEDVVDMM